MLIDGKTDLELTLEAVSPRGWQVVLLREREKKPDPIPKLGLDGKQERDADGKPVSTWDLTTDVESIDHHSKRGGNLGLVAGERSGVAIIDDDKPELFAEIEAALGPLGQPWVETGRGRHHYYFAWEPGLPAKLLWHGRIVGEIQRGGTCDKPVLQQVVIPPSVHPETGRRYRYLVNPVTTPLPSLPATWRAHLLNGGSHAQPPAQELAAPTSQPQPGDSARLARALAQPGARRRSDGSVKFRCPACASVGKDQERDNAILYADGRYGCAGASGTPYERWHRMAIAEALGARDADGVSVDGPAPEITSATITEVLAADPTTLQTTYIVTPWVPRGGLSALASRFGVGKGKLTQDLCIARASGGTWLGLPVEPGPAMFWSGEQGRREDFRVTQALCRGRGLTRAAQFPHCFQIVYDPSVRFGHPIMTAYVMNQVREHPGLLIVIDSQRRAFEGDENDSGAADHFYRTVLMPLRIAGATILTLAHPPKTTGQQKAIADENMIRGSGDWTNQLDSFMVLRPVNRDREDSTTETITMRLIHVKPRSGPQATPLLVTMRITKDLTPLVTFTLTAKEAASDESDAAVAGATKAMALLFEEKKRLNRQVVIDTLKASDHGRPACEAALEKLVELGVIHGPLTREEKRKGERGNWYLFVKPLPTPQTADDAPDWPHDTEEDPDEA